MTDHYRYVEPMYDVWRRIAYSAATWTVVTLALAYLSAWYIGEAMWLHAALYCLFTLVAGTGTLWNATEGHWL